MEIRVAIIGPFDLMETLITNAKAFPSLHILPYGYLDVDETVGLLRQCKDQADVLLFAGPIPYEIARAQGETGIPMLFIPLSGMSLYRVFFQLLRESQGKLDQLRFSIDVLNRAEIEECMEELDIVAKSMHVKEYNSSVRTQDIVNFHYERWQRGEVDTVLTCVNSVHKQLLQLGVPSYKITPTKLSIQETFYRVELEGRSALVSDTQIAIGIIHLDSLAQRSLSEYEIQRKKLAVHQLLLDYGEEIKALLNWSDREEITFVTTRGVIERTTLLFTRYPLLDQIANQLNVTVSIGIGLGRTANEAESMAREALLKAQAGGGGSCYIVIQDGSVVGPLGKEYQLEYSVRSNDPERIRIARQAGLSVGTINKLLSYCESYGSFQMTAAELANGFNITIRSARRILSKLEQCSLAHIVGEEQPVSKGRPRQLYQIDLGIKERDQPLS